MGQVYRGVVLPRSFFARFGGGHCMADGGVPRLYWKNGLTEETCQETCALEEWCQAFHFGFISTSNQFNCALFVSPGALGESAPAGFERAGELPPTEITTTDATKAEWT